MPVVCSKEIINCSRSLCANIGRDLVLPARLFIYSKSGGKLRRKQSERICLNLVLTSSTSSDASTDSSISQCESSQCHEQEREQTGIPNCRPRLSSRRPKSSPCSTTPTSSSRLQRQSLARSPWTSRKDSTHRDTVTKDIFQLPSRSRSSRDNFSALSRCEQSSSSSSSLISESVASRPLDSAVSKNTTDHFSMSSDSTDNVFVRLSRPKLSTVENNQSEAVKQRPLSVVGIELFERLSMPKVLPKPHVLSPSKTRDSKLIDNELFERLAKPKSQTLRRHSEIPQPLKDKFLNSSLETFSGRRSSLQSYRRNSHGLAPVTHQQSSSHVKRHAQTRPINSPIFKTHQLISDTIFEDEDLTCPKKRTTSQSSLDAFDVTREASDLLSTFQYSTDLDDLRLLEEESEDGSEAEVFLSSIDSRISQRSLAEMIQEVPYLV